MDRYLKARTYLIPEHNRQRALCQAMSEGSFKNRFLFIYVVIKIDNGKKCSDLNYGEKI